MEFKRIHVKGVENVDLGEALQDDPKAAAKFAEFSDLVVQLTKIVSDSMAHVNKALHAA
mgnify:CR=1 FL=1